MVRCDDGRQQREIRLNGPAQGLLIPPTLWAEQIYEESNTALMVLCDKPYDGADYIRDYSQFLEFRKMITEAQFRIP